jgi:hypothetical protein
MNRHLVIVYTGQLLSGVHTTLKALDPSTPWCPEENVCPAHRAYGRHIAAGLDNYVEELDITFQRHAITYDLQIKAGQQRGSAAGPITHLFDVRPEIRQEFERMKRCDASCSS